MQYSSAYGYSAAGTALSQRRRGDPLSRRGWLIAAGLVVPLLLLGMWQLAYTLQLVPAYRLPSPQGVWLAAVDLAQRGLLWTDIGISLQRVLIGFFIGSIVGLVLGCIVGLSRTASAFFAPTIGGFRAVPSLAWVPLLVLYMGIS